MKNPVLDPRYDPPGSLSDQERLARVVAQTAVETAFADIRDKGELLKTSPACNFFQTPLRLDLTFATLISFAGGFAACYWFWR